MKKLDLYTFGHTPASIKLAELINERGYSGRKVTKILSGFGKIINDIETVPTNTAIALMNIIYREYKTKCDTLEIPFNTYTRNVLNHTYRMWLIRKNAKTPRKHRLK